MSEEYEVDGLTRRRFFALSGAVGAGTLLAGAGPPGQGWAQSPPAGCGLEKDTDTLWQIAQRCVATPSTCLMTTANYALVDGNPQNTHNYLLVPTKRRQGIECSLIWQPQEWNYWQSAWQHATTAGPTRVQYPAIGLGVNSVHGRRFNQLHIHMAGILPQVQKDLKDNEKKITKDPSKWKDAIVKVGAYNYRVLHLDSLSQNLFALAKNNLVPKAMGDQTMLVTKRDAGGFYILDSQHDNIPGGLTGGTKTCDFLLAYS
jgi:CDP-diacylglycerol pyrophosphatase